MSNKYRLSLESLEDRTNLSTVTTGLDLDFDSLTKGQLKQILKQQEMLAQTTSLKSMTDLNSLLGIEAGGRLRGKGSTTTTTTSLPALPSKLGFSNVTDTGLTLNWTDNANNETGYKIYRSTDGTNFSLVATLGANTKTFNDSGLNAGGFYYYRVSAYNDAGASSATVGVTLLSAAPAPAPTPTPTPDPTPTPTPTPTPAPTNQTFTTDPISWTTKQMNGFVELVITGTTGNDSILIAQSGNVLTITANGQTQTVTGAFGDMVIHGGAGDDLIAIDGSVVLRTNIYGDTGSNTINALGAGRMTIVSIGGQADTLTGNGVNTSYWADQAGVDIINASSKEIAGGMVHRVANFYQPWTNDTTNADYISKNLNGQNLRDPSDAGAVSRNPNASLWGAGPAMEDVIQGSLADCYFVSPLASLANSQPGKLQELAVDLGDGTYAVQFTRGGVQSFVRVDGDLTNGGSYFAHARSSGNLWASIMEKAYAFFRNGQNTYASLAWGYHNQTFSDFGIGNSSTLGSSSNVFSSITNALAGGKAVTAQSQATVSSPSVAKSHVYSVVNAFTDASGNQFVTVRNPWGNDGMTGSDNNYNDGLVTLSLADFQKNFYNVVWTA